jgi:hypothetical protein
MKKPFFVIFSVLISATMLLPVFLFAGEWFEFNEDFSGNSSNEWTYSRAKWSIQDGKLNVSDIETPWMAMASAPFWAWDYFVMDVDVLPLAVPDPDGAFGIYVRPYSSNPLPFGGGKVDLVGATYFAKAGVLDLAGWDIVTQGWLATEQFSPSGPVSSIGFTFRKDGMTLRINKQEVGLTLPAVAAENSWLFISEVTLSAWGEGTVGSFDNVRAASISGEGPGPSGLLPPSNLRCSFSGTHVTVSWDGVAGASGYRMGIGMQPGDYFGVYNMGSATSIGPVDVSGVAPGTYFVAVKSYDGASESAYSEAIPVAISPPGGGFGAPKSLRYETAGVWLTVVWDRVQGAEGYRLHVGTQPGSYLPPIDMGNADRIGPIDTRVLGVGSYYVTVSAYNTQQESAPANGLEVRVGGQVSFGTTAVEGGVSGRCVSYPSGKETSFSAQPMSEEGRGSARYETAGSGETLDVRIDAPDSGHIIWKGVKIDGNGALTAEEETALRELATSELYRTMMMAPLEVACSAVSDPSSPALAALLLPWQMILKYLEANAVGAVRVAAHGASCAFFPDQKTGPPPGGQSAKQAALILSNAAPLPVVLGYFPMDAEGAFGMREAMMDPVDSDSWIESPRGPCNALCRGACGADCPVSENVAVTKNCERSEDRLCVKDEATGRFTGKSRTRVTYTCGTHPGCQEHDDCYDECNRKYGCDTFRAAWCRHNFLGRESLRGCDLLAADKYGPSVGLWAQGLPGYQHKPEDRFTGQLRFEYWEGPETEDPQCDMEPISSCFEPGAVLLHKLCSPPPYWGCEAFVCSAMGRLWLQTPVNIYQVVALNKGYLDLEGCYWNSSVVTQAWTYEGNLCPAH